MRNGRSSGRVWELYDNISHATCWFAPKLTPEIKRIHHMAEAIRGYVFSYTVKMIPPLIYTGRR